MSLSSSVMGESSGRTSVLSVPEVVVVGGGSGGGELPEAASLNSPTESVRDEEEFLVPFSWFRFMWGAVVQVPDPDPLPGVRIRIRLQYADPGVFELGFVLLLN